ncbi:MAG: nucleoside-diphosphate kinase [Verrucomicrobiales bacterium]|nr:nucleoside-diphosphate kinase [Verrucomicrobiales bacterium]
MATERTLILLKPDCVADKHCGEVIRRFETAGYTIRGAKMLRLTDALLKDHYAHIADRPFFPTVAAFMQSKPVVAMVIEGDNVVSGIRDMLGPTDSTTAAKGTLRGDFGVDKMVNVCHASDSVENAEAEVARFFQPDEIFDY